MGWLRRNPDDGSGGCWSCGTLTRKHGKGCKAKAGRQPARGGGRRGRGEFGKFPRCGAKWTYPAKEQVRGQHINHTCGNPIALNARDGMCSGPHMCVKGDCPNPTRSK